MTMNITPDETPLTITKKLLQQEFLVHVLDSNYLISCLYSIKYLDKRLAPVM